MDELVWKLGGAADKMSEFTKKNPKKNGVVRH